MNYGITLLVMGAGLFLMGGCTTLHTAASKGRINAIERLADEGANLNERDEEGMTPLIYSIRRNQKGAMAALLNAGADVNAADSQSGNTPLHEAVIQGNSQFVSLLLLNGAKFNLPNRSGKTAMNLAKESRNEKIIESFAEYDQLLKPAAEAKEETKHNLPTPFGAKSPLETKVTAATLKPEPAPISKEEAITATAASKPPISSSEALAALEGMIERRETMGIRSFLNEHPEALNLIKEPRQRIRYVGPDGWRVIDIIEGTRRGNLKEQEVIDHILISALPYQRFTAEESEILIRYGISVKIINAMAEVSR